MKVKIYLTALLSSAVLFSCVSPKKLRESQAKYDQLSGTYLDLQSKYRALQDELNKANNKNAALQSAKTNTDGQVDDLKKTDRLPQTEQ